MASLEQISQALLKADAAGDTESAKVLANEYRRVSSGQSDIPKEEEDLPLWKTGDIVDALGDVATNVLPSTFAGIRRGWEGIQPEHSQGYTDAMRADAERSQKVLAENDARRASGDLSVFGKNIREVVPSLGFMGASIPATIIGAKTGASAGVRAAALSGNPEFAPQAALAGGVVGGGVAGFTAAYRMMGAQFMDDAIEHFNDLSLKELKRPLNKEERQKIFDDLLPVAENTALWEAGPEAIGNLATLGAGKIILGIGKPAFKALARGAKAKVLAATGERLVEHSTEGITEFAQGNDQQKLEAYKAGIPMSSATPKYQGVEGLWESTKEVAPAVATLGVLMGGAGAVAHGATKLLSKEKNSYTQEDLDKIVSSFAGAAQEEMDEAKNATEGGSYSRNMAIAKASEKLQTAKRAEKYLADGQYEDAAAMFNGKLVEQDSAPTPTETASAPTEPTANVEIDGAGTWNSDSGVPLEVAKGIVESGDKGGIQSLIDNGVLTPPQVIPETAPPDAQAFAASASEAAATGVPVNATIAALRDTSGVEDLGTTEGDVMSLVPKKPVVEQPPSPNEEQPSQELPPVEGDTGVPDATLDQVAERVDAPDKVQGVPAAEQPVAEEVADPFTPVVETTGKKDLQVEPDTRTEAGMPSTPPQRDPTKTPDPLVRDDDGFEMLKDMAKMRREQGRPDAGMENRIASIEAARRGEQVEPGRVFSNVVVGHPLFDAPHPELRNLIPISTGSREEAQAKFDTAYRLLMGVKERIGEATRAAIGAKTPAQKKAAERKFPSSEKPRLEDVAGYLQNETLPELDRLINAIEVATAARNQKPVSAEAVYAYQIALPKAPKTRKQIQEGIAIAENSGIKDSELQSMLMDSAKSETGQFAGPYIKAQRIRLIEEAMEGKKPVSAEAVDTYGITLPEGYVRQGDLYVFSPQTKESETETAATEGTVMPGGSAIERDTSKPEQMTPEERRDAKIQVIAVETEKGLKPIYYLAIREGDSIGIYGSNYSETDGELIGSAKPVNLIARPTLEEVRQVGSSAPAYIEKLAIDEGAPIYRANGIGVQAAHQAEIASARLKKAPVSKAAVDTYGITLPEGYVRQGDLYIFSPQTAQAAAETQTPAPSRKGAGVAPDPFTPADDESVGAARNAEAIRQAAARLKGTEKGPDLGFSKQQPTGKKDLQVEPDTRTDAGMENTRDATKPEQMTPEDFTSSSRDDELPKEYVLSDGNGNFVTREKNGHLRVWRLTGTHATLAGTVGNFADGSGMDRAKRRLQEVSSDMHKEKVGDGVRTRKPVSAEAVDTYGITLPEGYVRQGELYIFQPSSEQSGLGAGAATAPAKEQMMPDEIEQDPDIANVVPEKERGGRWSNRNVVGDQMTGSRVVTNFAIRPKGPVVSLSESWNQALRAQTYLGKFDSQELADAAASQAGALHAVEDQEVDVDAGEEEGHYWAVFADKDAAWDYAEANDTEAPSLPTPQPTSPTVETPTESLPADEKPMSGDSGTVRSKDTVLASTLSEGESFRIGDNYYTLKSKLSDGRIRAVPVRGPAFDQWSKTPELQSAGVVIPKNRKVVKEEPAGRVSVDPRTDELLGNNDRGEPVYWSDNAKTHYAISGGRVRTAPWIEGLPERAIDRLHQLYEAPSKAKTPRKPKAPKPVTNEDRAPVREEATAFPATDIGQGQTPEVTPAKKKYKPNVGDLISGTVNGVTVVGKVTRVSGGGTVTAEYGNGKEFITNNPLPAAQALATAPKYQYTQEQNTAKAARLGLPTTPGVTEDAGALIQNVLVNVSKDTRLSPLTRAIARALRSVNFDGVRLRIKADGRSGAGLYTHENGAGEIMVNLRAVARGQVDSIGVFLHEALHHATMEKLFNPAPGIETEAVDAIKKIVDHVKTLAGPDTVFDYELGSPWEFVSALFTRPDFQNYLATVPAPDSPKGIAKFRSALSELFRRIAELVTGQKVQKGSTMEQAIAATMVLFETPQRTGDGAAGAMADRDAEYMAAVEAGDMATAQRMVDEAAKAAGYNVGPVYHGTEQEGLTEFFGGWWSDQKATTKEFGGQMYSAFLRGPLAFAEDLRPLYVEFNGTDIDPDSEEAISDSELGDAAMSGGPFSRFVQEKGFQGIAVWDESNAVTGMAYAVFNPEQIKSADPVTRDNDGNVIPLSQRFNETSNDIRYAASTNAPATSKLSPDKARAILTKRFGKAGGKFVVGAFNADGDIEWDAKIGDGNITLNLKYLDTEAKLIDKAEHELAHAVFDDPTVQEEWKAISRTLSPTAREKLAARLKGLGYADAVLDEEMLVQTLEEIRRNTPPAAWQRFVKAVRDALLRLFGMDVSQGDAERAAARIVAAGEAALAQGLDPAVAAFGQSVGEASAARDAEYLAAVEAGDMEKAQEMVDEAAKAAGYDVKAWHGSQSKEAFTEFKPNKQGSGLGLVDGPGYYFTTSENEARDNTPFGQGLVVSAFLKLNNPVGRFQKGGDSIRYNLGSYDHIVVRSPSQIKSADPITRDESGAVIPLSQRFNETSNDIRYSRVNPDSELNKQTNVQFKSEKQRNIRPAAPQQETANKASAIIGEAIAKDPVNGRMNALLRFDSDTKIPGEVRVAGAAMLAEQVEYLNVLNMRAGNASPETTDLADDFVSRAISIVQRLGTESGRTTNFFNALARLTGEGFVRRQIRQHAKGVDEVIRQNFEGDLRSEIERLWKAMQDTRNTDRGKAFAEAVKEFLANRPERKKDLDEVFKSIRTQMAEAGGESLVRDFFQMMAGPRDQAGPLAEFDASIQSALSGMLRKVMESKGLVAENQSVQATDIDKLVRSVSADALRFEKIAAADAAMQEELDKIEDPERRAVLQQAWEEATSKMYTNIASEATLRRAVNAELKETPVEWTALYDKNRGTDAEKRRVVAAVMAKVEALLTNAGDKNVQQNLDMLRSEVAEAFDQVASIKHAQWLAGREAAESRRRTAERKAAFVEALKVKGISEKALLDLNAKLDLPARPGAERNEVSVLIGDNIKAPVEDFVAKLTALGVDQDTAEALDKVSVKLRAEYAEAARVAALEALKLVPTKLTRQAIERLNSIMAGPMKPHVKGEVATLISDHSKAITPDFVERMVALGVDRAAAVDLDNILKTSRVDRFLASLLKVAPERNKTAKEKLSKVIRTALEAGNLGAMDSQQFMDLFAKEFGLPPMTKEFKAEIKEMVRGINALPKGPARIDAIQALEEKLALWEGIKTRDLMMSTLYANWLSGISTQAIGLIYNNLNLLLKSVVTMLANPKSAKAFVQGALGEGLRTGLKEALAALQGRGLYKASKWGDKKMIDSLGLLSKQGPRGAAQWAAYLASVGTLTRKVFHVMEAVDALAWNTAREGHAYLAAHRALREELASSNPTAEEFSRKFVEKLGGDTAQIEADLREARDQRIAAGATPDLTTIDRMARQMRDDRRAEAGVDLQSSNRFADRVVVQQEPEGIGRLISALITAIQQVNVIGVPVGQMLVPFNKIVSNLFEQSLDYTPVGIVRGALGGHLTDVVEFTKDGVKFREGSKMFDSTERWERAITGTLATSIGFALYALAASMKDEDDEDVPFMIYAFGPTDKNKRSQMPKGWAPFTIKIGDVYYRYAEAPFGMMFAGIGSALDAIRYEKMDDKTAVDKLTYVMKYAAKGFMTQGVLSSVDTAIDVLMLKASDKKLSDIPVSAMKGAIPGQGLLRDLSTLTDDRKIDGSTMKAALLRDIPFVKSYAGKPELNAFGEPVTFDGFPVVRRFVTGVEKNHVADYLGRNDLYIPGMPPTIEVGSYLPKEMKDRLQRRALEVSAMENGMFTPEQNYEFKKRAGQLTKVAVERIMSASPPITNDVQRKKVQSVLNKQIEIARKRAMLEAVPIK